MVYRLMTANQTNAWFLKRKHHAYVASANMQNMKNK